MDLKQIATLLEQFRTEFERNGDMQKCKKMLSQLKIAMTQFSYLLPGSAASSPTAKQESFLARELLELAALLAVKLEDILMFERHIAQLKPYYFDVHKIPSLADLPPSQRQYSILGLNLLRLLTQNRMAEFHTELELIPHDMLGNVFVAHPVELERLLMEGNYNKVMTMRDAVPSEYFRFFMDILVDTIRNEVADCCVGAYESLPVAAAQRLLFLEGEGDFARFVEERKWQVSDGRLTWANGPSSAEPATVIPTTKLLRQTVAYARELELII